MKITYSIYVVTDSFGNKDATVVNESSDSIQLCGLKNHLGEALYFECEAYHLTKWCHDNDLEVKVYNVVKEV